MLDNSPDGYTQQPQRGPRPYGGGGGSGQQTFRQMQQQGVARPPQPSFDDRAGGAQGAAPYMGQPSYQQGEQAMTYTGGMSNQYAPQSGYERTRTQLPGNRPQIQPQAQPPQPGAMTVQPPAPYTQQTGGSFGFPPQGGFPGMGGNFQVPDLTGTLFGQYAGYQGMPGFQYQQSTFAAPQYQGPGWMGQSGQTQGVSPFQATLNNQLQQGLNASVLQGLQNPSAYTSQNMLGMFDAANNRLGQEFDLQRQAINEDAARRGLNFSTIPAGRLGDVAIRQSQAQTDMMQNLLGQAAQQYGSDRALAQQLGMGLSGQQFGQGLEGYQANLAGTGLNEQLLNGMFNRNLGVNQFNLGAANQQFGNQLAGQQFLANQANQGFGNAATAYGMNLGANQQNFAQRQALLDSLLGYGQQGFMNQLTTAQFNADQDRQQQALWMALLGMGG